MHADNSSKPPRASAPVIRRRAVVGLVLFIAVSAGLHFTLGPELTKLSPHWAASQVPDQALSIVTLSRKQEQVLPPAPTPTPPPIPLPRTKRDLALIKYREIGSEIRMRPDIRPPARRKSTLVVDHPIAKPHDSSKDADVVAVAPEPTPQASEPPGSARAATGGNTDEMSGSIVWGDDNPPRLIRRAPLAVDDRAAGIARVQVEVSPDGKVVAATLVQSSGDPAVDQAALDAARSSTYAPATLNGMPVHGTVVMEFAPSAQSI